MHKLSKNKKGFSHLELILFIFIIGVVALIGAKLLTKSHAETVGGPTVVTATNVYDSWSWPGNSYYNFDLLVEPQTDPSPQGIFWAEQFQFTYGTIGYIGLQTEGDNPTGKIAVFQYGTLGRRRGHNFTVLSAAKEMATRIGLNIIGQ